jgi:site-specific DNA recombinase
MTTLLEGERTSRISIVGKAAIYTRVSSDRQREEGASLDVQRDACLRYCAANGLLVMGEFTDVQSGLDADRPQYMRAVEMARARGVDKLVVWRYDRLGRDAAEYLPLIKGLKRIGIDVVSVTQPTESYLMQGILGLMAEEESRQLSVRVSASKQRRFNEGKWGGTPPFGYSNQKHPDGGSVLVPNDEAPLITEMFHRYASGKHSLNDLRRYLKESGHLKSRYAIWYILTNEVYVGRVKHGRYARSQFMVKPAITTAQGKHQPLIDQETFDKVQVRLSANKSRNRGGTAPKYLFSGLVYCANCGYKYIGRTSAKKKDKRWVVYYCGRKVSFSDCPAHSIFETRIRAAVIQPIEALLGQLKQDEFRAAVRDELTQQQQAMQTATQQTKESLAETQKRLEGRLSRLEDSFLDGDLSRDRYLTRRDEIMGQLEEVRAQLAERPHLALPDMEQIFAIVDALGAEPPDDLEWREIVEGMVERVVIEGERGGSNGRAEQGTVKVIWKPDFAPLLDTVTER